MTPRCYDIAAFQILLRYSGWDGTEPEDLSTCLHEGVTDPSLNNMPEVFMTPYKTLDPPDWALRLGSGPAHRDVDLEFWSLYSLAFELRDQL